jgi:hypothetical protein
MTLPFVTFSLSFRPRQLSGAILSVPVDDHFPVIAGFRRGRCAKADDRSAKNRSRPPAAPHPVSFIPSFMLIHPTPQEAINLPFTFVF